MGQYPFSGTSLYVRHQCPYFYLCQTINERRSSIGPQAINFVKAQLDSDTLRVGGEKAGLRVLMAHFLCCKVLSPLDSESPIDNTRDGNYQAT